MLQSQTKTWKSLANLRRFPGVVVTFQVVVFLVNNKQHELWQTQKQKTWRSAAAVSFMWAHTFPRVFQIFSVFWCEASRSKDRFIFICWAAAATRKTSGTEKTGNICTGATAGCPNIHREDSASHKRSCSEFCWGLDQSSRVRLTGWTRLSYFLTPHHSVRAAFKCSTMIRGFSKSNAHREFKRPLHVASRRLAVQQQCEG